jgi:predicted nuclease of predicted toxin-antitoxin system
MKLLFDQNLSRHVVRRLVDMYPDSNHILLLGLEQEPDAVVWQYARAHGYIVVTKDADFSEL